MLLQVLGAFGLTRGKNDLNLLGSLALRWRLRLGLDVRPSTQVSFGIERLACVGSGRNGASRRSRKRLRDRFSKNCPAFRQGYRRDRRARWAASRRGPEVPPPAMRVDVARSARSHHSVDGALELAAARAQPENGRSDSARPTSFCVIRRSANQQRRSERLKCVADAIP